MEVARCGARQSECNDSMAQCNTAELTRTREESTKQKVPDLPIPALQCITAGPTSGSSAPASLTAYRKFRKAIGDVGTPKSGHVM